MDDGVREKHGCVPYDGRITLSETEALVTIAVYQNSTWQTTKMTPTQARYLAGRLRRLARRVDERNVT